MAARKHLLAALCVAATAAAPLQVYAQPRRPTPPPPAQPAHVAEAREAYDEGTAQYAAGHYQEALTAFHHAYELRSNPVVLLPIIECHRQLGQSSEELAAIEHYLRDLPNAPTRTQLEARATELRGHTTTTHVGSTPPGATITVDGHPTGHTTPADIELTSGQHVVTLTLDGYTMAEQPVDVTAGTPHPVDLTLVTLALAPTPPTEPTPPVTEPQPPTPVVTTQPVAPPEGSTPPVEESHPASGWTPVVITTASVAGAAFIASAVFGGLALSDSNSYSTAPTQGLYDSGRREALFCDVGWIVGALATGVAVVVYLSSRGHHDDTNTPAHAAAARWMLAPSGAGVSF